VTRGSLQRVLSVVRRSVDPDATGPLADERLLARFAKNGDPSAFELLVWRHGTMVMGVCRRVLGDHHLAEDAFQATFLALARKPRAVRTGAALAGWLHRVARRIAVRAKVDCHKRAERDHRVARPELVAPPDILSAEAQELIDAEIDRLPEWQRRAVVLCYLDGHTADQAAQMLGCPRGTVLSRLAAARERLRGRLIRRGLTIPAAGFALGVSASEVSAGVVASTAKAVLGGGASIQVIGWTNGVLTAMVMNKIKLATAAVLTTGMLGTGVGWVVVPGHGPGIVGDAQAATDPRTDEAAHLRDQVQSLRRKLDEQLASERKVGLLAEQTMAELQRAKAEAEVANTNRKEAEAKLAAIMARLKEIEDRQDLVRGAERANPDLAAVEKKLMAAEIRLKRAQNRLGDGAASKVELEQALAEVNEARAEALALSAKEDQAIAGLERKLKDLLAEQMNRENQRSDEVTKYRIRLAQEEERLKALDRQQHGELDHMSQLIVESRSDVDRHKRLLTESLAAHGPDHPEVAKIKAALSEGAKMVEKQQAELHDRQAKVLAERIKARELMVRLEEEAKAIERRMAIEEHDLAAKRAALQDRLRQTGGAATDRLGDIERKLDTLARELADLRREMKK
jgi:RNA polymerase sigma factor (sigma-70 family)